MNFAICFVLLALAACAHSAPTDEKKYTDNTMFEGDMNEIQGMMLDIVSAGQDLQMIEGKLSQVLAAKDDFITAEKKLEAAVDKKIYENAFNSEST